MAGLVAVEVAGPAVHVERAALAGQQVRKKDLLDYQIAKRDVAVEVCAKTETRIDRVVLRNLIP
jgi:hypothetical protein